MAIVKTYPKVVTREDSADYQELRASQVGFIELDSNETDVSLIEGNIADNIRQLQTSIPSLFSQFFAYQYAMEFWCEQMSASFDPEKKMTEVTDTNIMVSELLDVFELIYWWQKSGEDEMVLLDETDTEVKLIIDAHPDFVKQLFDASESWKGDMGKNLFATAFKDTAIDNFQLSDNAACFTKYSESPDKWLSEDRNFEEDTQSFSDLPYFFILLDDKIVACTSPVTGFALPYDKVGVLKIPADLTGEDENPVILFDVEQPRALCQRSIDFQRFFFAFFKTYESWMEVEMPLQVLGKFNKVYFDKLKDFNKSDFKKITSGIDEKYGTESFTEEFGITNLYFLPDEKGKSAKINIWGKLGVFTYNNISWDSESQDNLDKISEESDFALTTGFRVPTGEMQLRPLILTDEDQNIDEDWLYVPEYFFWKKSYRVKPSQFPLEELYKSSLPGFPSLRYPYFSEEDFLIDSILSLPYPVNEDAFIVPEIDYQGLSSKEKAVLQENFFIPPLTKDFYRVFGKNGIRDYVKMSVSYHHDEETQEMRMFAKIVVKIPVNRPNKERQSDPTFITFTRFYKENKEWVVLDDSEASFDLTCYPNFITGIPKLDHFWVMLVKENLSRHINLEFYAIEKEGEIKLIPEQAEPSTSDDREKGLLKVIKSNRSIRSTHYRIPVKFDLISVKVDHHQEFFLLPDFEDKKLSKNFEYIVAVDFGTTNTYFEIKKRQNGQLTPIPLDQPGTSVSTGVIHLHKKGIRNIGIVDYASEYQKHELFPGYYGEASGFTLPLRTSLAYARGLGKELDENDLFLKANIHTRYGQEGTLKDYLTDTSDKLEPVLYSQQNLKWGNENEGYRRLFIKELLYWVRNRIIMENDDPSHTKLVWFYPLSMDISTRNNIKEAWRKALAVLGIETSDDKTLSKYLRGYSESISPYAYEKLKGMRKPTFQNNNVLLMDVGGGSTDMALIPRNDEELFSFSSVIAGNAFFQEKENGFYKHYALKFNERFAKSEQQERNEVLAIREALSLGNNLEFMNMAIRLEDLDFSRIANGTDPEEKGLRLVILFHYAINVYYSAIYSRFLSAKEDNHSFVELSKYQKDFISDYSSFPKIHHSEPDDKDWAKKRFIPHAIILTGNGSRLYWLLSNRGNPAQAPSEKDFEILSSFTTAIYKFVFSRDEIAEIEIISSEEPKKVTAQGGVSFFDEEYSSIKVADGSENQKFIIGGKGPVSKEINQKFINGENQFTPQMSNVDDVVKKEVENAVSEFINLFFALLEKQKNLGQNRFEIPFDDPQVIKKELSRVVEDFLVLAHSEWTERSKSNPLTISPFFFPMPGLIAHLSNVIYDNVTSNHS